MARICVKIKSHPLFFYLSKVPWFQTVCGTSSTSFAVLHLTLSFDSLVKKNICRITVKHDYLENKLMQADGFNKHIPLINNIVNFFKGLYVIVCNSICGENCTVLFYSE